MTTTDTAALAANDQTLGEMLANAQPPAEAQPTDAPAATEAAPEIPSQDEVEASLRARIGQLEYELRQYKSRREEEEALLSRRNATLHAIEGAKARLTSEKKTLAEIEEEIAALLASSPKDFAETPLGEALSKGEFAPKPEEPKLAGWADVLPLVGEESLRMLVGVGDELPSPERVCSALLPPEAMTGEARKLADGQTVTCYGKPWIVSHLWNAEDGSGTLRANVLPLYTKDEWQQLHEAKFGRFVVDFDQSDEAKSQRQQGGDYCGLSVKIGRKTLIVGPQCDALHLAYDAPEEGQDEEGDEDEGQHMGPGIPA